MPMPPDPEDPSPAGFEMPERSGAESLPASADPAVPEGEVPDGIGARESLGEAEIPPSEATVSEPEDAVAQEAEAAADESAGDGPPSPEALRIAEALVFASATPVTAARLAPLLPTGAGAAATLAALAQTYEGRGVRLVNVAGGYAFRTAEDLAPALTRVVEVPRRLPRVAMEALAIIAWHQPVTRAEIEEIRGTALSQTTLETLLENGLVAPRGKKEAPGRPTLWATTPKFLEQFGLASLRDLPRREELMPEPGLPLPEPAPAPGGG